MLHQAENVFSEHGGCTAGIWTRDLSISIFLAVALVAVGGITDIW